MFKRTTIPAVLLSFMTVAPTTALACGSSEEVLTRQDVESSELFKKVVDQKIGTFKFLEMRCPTKVPVFFFLSNEDISDAEACDSVAQIEDDTPAGKLVRYNVNGALQCKP